MLANASHFMGFLIHTAVSCSMPRLLAPMTYEWVKAKGHLIIVMLVIWPSLIKIRLGKTRQQNQTINYGSPVSTPVTSVKWSWVHGNS